MQCFSSLDATGQINFFSATSVLCMSVLKNLINSWGIEQAWVFEEQASGETKAVSATCVLILCCLWGPVGFEIVGAARWFPLLFQVGSSECEVAAVALGV